MITHSTWNGGETFTIPDAPMIPPSYETDDGACAICGCDGDHSYNCEDRSGDNE